MANAKPKGGLTTSEFILAIVTLLIDVLNVKLGLGMTDVQLASLNGVTMTYIGGRTWLKK